MGLAAPKNRSKLSNDPQNTTWANNTTRFGHRILTSQGWQPGDSLGAADAAHAAHYTAASQSHIRVLLKDDNLGLGAKRGSERAENFGLAGLESILGRLNGKEEEVKKEEERREQIETRAFVYRKYGFMNFVSGGFLVGDTITKKADMKAENLDVKLEAGAEADTAAKKRKREDNTEREGAKECVDEEPKLKRKKKSMDLREEARLTMDKKSKKSSKEEKERKSKKKSKKSSSSSTGTATPEVHATASDSEPLTDKARRKAERKVRKEEKKLKKALKKAAKKAAKSNPSAEALDSSSDEEEGANTTSASSAASPFATGTSTPVLASAGLTFDATKARGMHAVRQRWIRQKRAATMDTQAMNEIFMIKSRS